MKLRSIQIVCVATGLLAILLATGCGDRQAPSSSASQTVNGKADPAIKSLEAHVGMTFPSNTVLLRATDGGIRDSSFGYYAWGLFSPNAIKMPPTKAMGAKEYIKLSLKNAVEFVRIKVGKRNISQAQSAFGSEWETNGYTFRGTVVRSPQGDYLVIERFRKT